MLLGTNYFNSKPSVTREFSRVQSLQSWRVISGIRGSLQRLPALDFRQDAHLLDGDFVQLLEALGLGNSVIDHDGVDVLHVRYAD